SIPMRFSVTTNPMTGTGGVSAGPGGQRVQMPRVVERRGTSMSTDPGRERVIAKLSQGDGAEKIRALEVLSVTSLIIRATEKATESEKDIGRELEGAVFRAADASPNIEAWFAFVRTAMGTPSENVDAIKQMVSSKYWVTQMLGMLAAQALTAEQEHMIVTMAAASASDPLV